jgi:hypothetical protein
MAMSVAEIVDGIHREGETLIGIRPELVFVGSDTRVVIAPRAERLLTASDTRYYPFDTAYAAPEVYEGHPSTVESDIYSFCATIAFWSQGRHPFGRSTLQVQYRAAMHEVPDCDGVEEPLRSLIMIGLSPEPSRRPKLESIVGMLSLMSSSGGN